jgi:hypothetical protein
MGLMDRDYWREKHTQRPNKRPDLSHLQRSLDEQLQARPTRGASRLVTKTASSDSVVWLRPAALFFAICLGVVVVLWIVNRLTR